MPEPWFFAVSLSEDGFFWQLDEVQTTDMLREMLYTGHG